MCSKYGQEGHRWSDCTTEVKKCFNCAGAHRTLAMSCPVKKEAIQQTRERTQNQKKAEQAKQYNEVARTIAKQTIETQPPKTKIVLQHDLSHTVLTACILAHLNNIAEPGSLNRHLNHLLRKNNPPKFIADDDVPSHKIFNKASPSRAVTPSQEELNEMLSEEKVSLPPPEQPR